MKLNGWQRIGLILSSAWFVGAFWVIRQRQIKFGEDWAKHLMELCMKTDTVNKCMESTNDAFEKAYLINWEEIFLYGALPIPITWLLVYLTINTVKWITRGFR
jgi:hypothetical protein